LIGISIPGHRDHVLETADRVAGGVGVDRGHGPVVAGVHGLEHVDDFLAARLADDDAVGTHPERVAQAVSLRDGALALDVRRAAFHPAHMRLLELEFGRILDREDPLGVVDEGRQRVEGGRLARTRAAGDDDVEPAGDRGLQIRRHLLGEGAEANEVVDREFLLLELPDRDKASVHRDRRHHRVKARAVSESGVDIGVRFVDATTDGGHDLVDDPQEVLLVLEGRVAERELARALDEDLLRAVHQDVVDRVVLKERFERAEARHLVEEVLVELLALLPVEDDRHLFQRFGRDRDDLGAQVASDAVSSAERLRLSRRRLCSSSLISPSRSLRFFSLSTGAGWTGFFVGRGTGLRSAEGMVAGVLGAPPSIVLSSGG
jgi:hypothetical protein